MRVIAQAGPWTTAETSGRKRITPFWRTLKSTGELNPKYPGGIAAQARRLRAEGLAIEPGRGKKPPTVKNLADHLTRPMHNSKTWKF